MGSDLKFSYIAILLQRFSSHYVTTLLVTRQDKKKLNNAALEF